jgi:hypothetical protein
MKWTIRLRRAQWIGDRHESHHGVRWRRRRLVVGHPVLDCILAFICESKIPSAKVGGISEKMAEYQARNQGCVAEYRASEIWPS